MCISFVNMVEVEELTRPYDFCLDEFSAIGKIFSNEKLSDFKDFFYKSLNNNRILDMHLQFMITAYREFGRIRIFYKTDSQKDHCEVVKEWLEQEIQKLRIRCNIY